MNMYSSKTIQLLIRKNLIWNAHIHFYHTTPLRNTVMDYLEVYHLPLAQKLHMNIFQSALMMIKNAVFIISTLINLFG